MKKHPVEPSHEIARALFALRVNLAATRAALNDDNVEMHRIVGRAIQNTRYWSDGLLFSKKRARRFIQDAYLVVGRLLTLCESPRGQEMTALLLQIMETIHIVLRRLCKDDIASNDDRIAARQEVERPWRLSEIAICYFISTEPACTELSDDQQN